MPVVEIAADVVASLPPPWRTTLGATLEPDERVLAAVRTDLDEHLGFAPGVVLLTDRRLAASTLPLSAGGPLGSAEAPVWNSWSLTPELSLRTRDRGGVAVLECFGPVGLVAQWQFTTGKAAAAQALVRRFEHARAGSGTDLEESDDSEAPIRTEEAEPAAARSLFRLLRFARQRLGLAIAGIALSVAATAVGLIPPYLTQPLVDKVLIPYSQALEAYERLPPAERPPAEEALQTAQRQQDVVFYLSAFAIASVLAWLLSWAQGIVMAWVSERISADMRIATYAHLQRLSIEYFGGKRTGDLMSRISTDTDRVCTFLSDNLVDFTGDVLMIVGSAAVLFSIDPILAAATLCPIPIIAWLIYRIRDSLKQGFGRGGRAWGQMTNVLADTIPGIRVVKAFAQERREIDRFRQANDRILDANDRVNLVWTFFWPMVALLNQLGLLVVWAAGAKQVFAGRVTVGVLTMFLAYIGRFYARLESMSRLVSAVQRAGAGARRVFEVLDQAPSVPEPAEPVPLQRLRGRIEVRDVGFRYGNRTILDGINLTIEPGEMIGLVGPSGSGKSTLVNLVCRFYDVASGAILVDGTDVRAYAVQDYRRNIGLVLQEPFLFYGTVAENIAYGKPDATHAEIVAAAKAAHAHDFILRLPLGYDSLVGERGQSLSGGERQRISIARALLIDPQILLLDEATSAVDNETEREIQAALDRLVQGRTTIAIAHRLTTLRKADRLVVLERGRIVETGQHDDLLAAGGVYARLHQAQSESSAEAQPD
jgi:ATP-binding cassette subfamily B protein